MMLSNSSPKVNENNNVEIDDTKDGFGLGNERYSDEISKCESVEYRVSGVSQFSKMLNNNERRSSLRRNVSKGNLMSSDHTESKVLVIYTGGTICMMRNENNGEIFYFYFVVLNEILFLSNLFLVLC